MKVVLVIQKLVGLRGGAERLVIELAEELARRGHDTTLITYEFALGQPAYDTGAVPLVNLFPPRLRQLLDACGADRSPRSAENAERTLSNRANVWPLTRVKWHATHGLFARRLARWIADHQPDVVVGFLPPAISAVAVAGVRLGPERPRLVASTHNVPSEDFGDSRRWDQNPVARRLNLWALEAVDAVTVLQPEFVTQLPVRARSHAVPLSNPVARLAPPSAQQRRPLIVGVGRLTDVKRYDVLIEAFSRIADDFGDWMLDIYGDGPEHERLEELASQLGMAKRVRVVGATSEIAEVYDSARILCHPSRLEGFGLSVAEGILHGTLVLASRDCPGINRLVQDGMTGVLVDEAHDPVGSFAAGLRQLIERPPSDTRRQVAAAALGERLDPRRVYDDWETLLAGSP